MKKTILVIAALALTYAGIAQDKYVVSALTALKSKNFDEAKQDIDKAIANPETKEKPKALFAKAQIYASLQTQEKYKASSPYKEAGQALLKLVEVKPDYEKEDVTMFLYVIAAGYYNEGNRAYNDKMYVEASDLLKNVLKIYNVGGGKRYEKAPFAKQFDTVAATAELQIARCAYALNNNEEVIRLINSLKSKPIGQTKDVYIILLESYEKYNKDNNNKMAAEETAATAEARAKFPEDPNIKNMEMNTLMKNGKTTDLLKKMEDDIAKEPNNADLSYNIGLVYQGLGVAKDGKKPANSADMMSKAETAFSRATKLAPENGIYNGALGSFYYLQGYEYNADMNLITGTSAADDAKYNDLKAKRDAMFTKSMAPYEKTVSIYSAKMPKVNGSDLDAYHEALIALKQIYIVLNKTDKIKDIEEKTKALDGK